MTGLAIDIHEPATAKALVGLLADGAVAGCNWYDPSDRRLAALAGRVALADPAWLLRCIAWLRDTETLAPAALVLAAEMVRARLGSGFEGGNRRIIGLVVRMPGEPGALLGYWIAVHGTVPKPVQRGIADVVKILYTEQAAAEHDRPGPGLRFGDVLAIAHPHPDSPRQRALFKRLLEQRSASLANRVPDCRAAPDPALAAVLGEAARTGRFPF